MYYLRTKSAADAIKFTVDQAQVKQPAMVAADVIESINTKVAPLDEVPNTKAAERINTFTAELQNNTSTDKDSMSQISCSLDNPDSCESCSG